MGEKKKTSKEIHRAAGCAVVDIPGQLHQGAAGACMVLEEAGHVLREERVPLQAEPPAGAEGEAGASGPESPGRRTGSTGRGRGQEPDWGEGFRCHPPRRRQARVPLRCTVMVTR